MASVLSQTVEVAIGQPAKVYGKFINFLYKIAIVYDLAKIVLSFSSNLCIKVSSVFSRYLGAGY